MLREKEFAEIPGAVVLLAFMIPFYFALFTFPFFKLSSIVNPLILDRFYYYTYPALVFFFIPSILNFIEYAEEHWRKSWRKTIPFTVLGIILLLTAIGPTLTASYAVEPIQNTGYEWLIIHTPIKENAPELNYDIMGYYHISKFPTHYAVQLFGNELATVDLVKNEQIYQPIVKISLFGFQNVIKPGIYWDEHAIAASDEKIFDNFQIGFYYEGK
jgi:hypothetical protein